MFTREWSYRKVATKVAAALVAFGTLMSVGMISPQTVYAGRPCSAQPDGSCKPANTDGIFLPPSENVIDFDLEEAEQVFLDMPIDTSGTAEHPVVAVDRKQVAFDYDVLPWLNPETNRTLVPIRPIAEAMGFDVTWRADRPSEVWITRGDTTIYFEIGKDYALVNDKVVYMDQPSVLVNDARTMVPLRFIAEAFGCKVDWVGEDGPEDPRAYPWDGGKYQIWIWAPWLYWNNYSLGDRVQAGNWNLH